MIKTMTSRERVVTALNRGIPDRVPINYFSNQDINKRLLEHFGITNNDGNKLLDALGVDYRGGGAAYTGPVLFENNLPGRNVDPTSGIITRWVEHESGGYWDYTDFPLKNADHETMANWPMPSPDDYDYAAFTDYTKSDAVGNYALCVGGAGCADVINSTGMLMSAEEVLIAMASEDEGLMAYLKRKNDVGVEVMERTIEAGQGRVDFLWIGEDLGTQNSPIISLDMYRNIIRPIHQRYIDLAKSFNLPVMIHTCGSSSWAYNDFIEMGISAVDTLQPEAKNMDPKYLKDNFGHALSFHGCISTAGALAYGTVEDVERDVKETLDIMMPGGGYLLAPTHMIQDNSPTENVLKMYEIAKEYGQY